MYKYYVLLLKEMSRCPLSGPFKVIQYLQNPNSPQQLWDLGPRCLLFSLWAIDTVGLTLAQLQIRLAHGLAVLNSELMVRVDTGTVSASRIKGLDWSQTFMKLIFFIHVHLFSELPSIVPFSFGRAIVDEGDFAQVTCSISKGDEPLKVSWSLKGDVVSSEPSLSTTMIGKRTSILIIDSVGYRHSGVYTCHASNKAGSVSYHTELRVNGIYDRGDDRIC